MNDEGLQTILSSFPNLSILVIGDYFLDRYLILDPALAEISLETGLEARQVIEIRNSPGAAGTIVSNLCALGIGQVKTLGVIGDDGQGHDLTSALNSVGADTTNLYVDQKRFTPTYTKPIDKSSGTELERLDIKNREELPTELEDKLIEALRSQVPDVHGIIALDQVQERNCGVVSDRVLSELTQLAMENSDKVFFADSRTRIGEFRSLILKPNLQEAVLAIHPGHEGPVDRALRDECARSFSARTGCPVAITLGSDGILCAEDDQLTHIPGISVPPPIDIVGAGDSVSAALVSALCGGATFTDAAHLGVLVSSITIQQLGTTGTASPTQVLNRHQTASSNLR